MIMRSLLVRGMAAGVLAGGLAAAFARIFGEPALNGGIAFEERVAAASGETPHMEIFSRGVQSTAGLVVAMVIYGAAIGGLFAVTFGTVYGRIGRLSAKATAAVLALAGFLGLFAVPFVKYPSNPPGASIDHTISERTKLYVVMLLLSVTIAVAAVVLGRRLVARFGSWNATLLGVGAYLLVIGVAGFALPPVDETPAGFPAAVLYDFRLASLGGQLVLWAALGLVFGHLADRIINPHRAALAAHAH
jgi:predicted cobalt transporter CbtA